MTRKNSKLGKIALTAAATAIIGAGLGYQCFYKPAKERDIVNNYDETQTINAPVDCTGYNSLARDLASENSELEKVPYWLVADEIKELNPDVETNKIQPGQELKIPDYSSNDSSQYSSE